MIEDSYYGLDYGNEPILPDANPRECTCSCSPLPAKIAAGVLTVVAAILGIGT